MTKAFQTNFELISKCLLKMESFHSNYELSSKHLFKKLNIIEENEIQNKLLILDHQNQIKGIQEKVAEI